jgi:hypothetical protein
VSMTDSIGFFVATSSVLIFCICSLRSTCAEQNLVYQV